MSNFNIDPSAYVPLEMRAGYDISFNITFDDETDITGGTYEVIFYTLAGYVDSSTVLNINTTNGLTVEAKRLTIYVSYEDNPIEQDCLFLVRRTEGDSRIPIFTGDVKVNV